MSINSGGGTVDRMSLQQRLEHGLLLLFLVLLIVSGISLVYHEQGWAHGLIALMGGLDGRFLVHRFAAVGLLVVGIWHFLGLLFCTRQQGDFRELRLGGKDLRMGWTGFRFGLTGKGDAPDHGRFTPMQKFQYWGILIGCLIMGISGAVLWSPQAALALFPKSVFDLMLVIHSSQAQVIFILFIIWHLYDTHLAGGNFPMNPAWLTGRMSEKVFQRRHPAAWRELEKGKGDNA